MIIGEKENQFPVEIKEILEKEGIKKLTDIQKKSLPHIFTEKNLVIISPSGTGKTLIAEIIVFLDVLSEREEYGNYELNNLKNLTKWELKKARKNRPIKAKTVFLVPLRALAEEKANHLAKVLKEYNIKIHMSMSEVDFNEDEIRKSHILISTFERFRTILGRLPNLISNVSNVIIDEFHLIGDKHRGTTLETILTSLKDKVRLILLSATAENPLDIANWLNAELITSKKRLVPLEYEIKTTFRPDIFIKEKISENLSIGSQVLVFCGTRLKAEETAIEYSNFIHQLVKKDKGFSEEIILNFLESIPLNRESLGNAQIYDLVRKGTAFHHAGLSRIAKKVIEELFRRGFVKVLFCTETLGAGINLPAREVIILDVKRWNNEWLSRNVFHQLIGRAGRPNYDVLGKGTIFAIDRREEESILERYWKKSNRDINNINNLEQKYEQIKSRISSRDDLERMVLTLVHNNKVNFDDLISLLQNSFLDFNMKNMNDNTGEYYKLHLLPLNTISFEQKSLFNCLEKEVEIRAIKNSNIENDSSLYEIIEGEVKYLIEIDRDKIKCTCGINNLLCLHKLAVFKLLPILRIKEIINNNFAILHNLQFNGYISETAQGRLKTTTKGSICAEMGNSIKNFQKLKDWLMYKLAPKKPTFNQILFEMLKFIPEIDDSDIDFSNDYFKRPIFEHVILGKDIIEVVKKYQLYEGDLLRVEANLQSLISSLLPLTDYLGLQYIRKSLEDLEKILSEVFRLSF